MLSVVWFGNSTVSFNSFPFPFLFSADNYPSILRVAKLENSYLAELVETLVVFLTSPNREIVKSAIGFIKVSIVSLPNSVITPSLPALVPALINWSHEHSNHFKVNIRHLFERMIRKYGYNEVERYVPEDDKKLVSSIRKRQARTKKKKLAQMEVEEEEDDEVCSYSLYLYFGEITRDSLVLSNTGCT